MVDSRQEPELVRFWRKVCKTESCWLWEGTLGHYGYGVFKLKKSKQQVYAHRYVMGSPEGKHVLHTCDNPPCVNPAHLYIADHQTNMKDRNKRGRTAVGERTGNVKLTEKQVVKLRTEYRKGRRVQELAKSFKISESQATKIIFGRAWQHLPGAVK